MFKILDYSNFNMQLVNHLMEFTYQESTLEIFEESYLKSIDSGDEIKKERAYEVLKTDYYDFIDLFMCEENVSQFIAVLELDGKYVCALRAVEIEKGIWLEEALETAREYRKQGYSFRLIEHLKEELKKRDAKTIIARIAKSNEKSINLHKKVDFKESKKTVIDEDARVYLQSLQFEYHM